MTSRKSWNLNFFGNVELLTLSNLGFPAKCPDVDTTQNSFTLWLGSCVWGRIRVTQVTGPTVAPACPKHRKCQGYVESRCHCPMEVRSWPSFWGDFERTACKWSLVVLFDQLWISFSLLLRTVRFNSLVLMCTISDAIRQWNEKIAQTLLSSVQAQDASYYLRVLKLLLRQRHLGWRRSTWYGVAPPVKC